MIEPIKFRLSLSIFQGSILTTMGILGIILSSLVIYLFLTRRIKLARCQNLFIINVAVSDVFVSTIGVFRGLGIIDGKYVGAPDGTANIECVIFAISLYSLGCSGMLALLPLTLDRAVAIILPLRHNSIMNKKTCALMFAATWSVILGVMMNDIVGYSLGSLNIQYYPDYHTCLFPADSVLVQNIILFIAPFLLIFLMYIIMLSIVVKTKRSCGWFLVIAIAVIATSLLSYTPTVLAELGVLNMSYEVSQILYTTFWYTNGIANPLIYVATHPKTRKFFSNCRRGQTASSRQFTSQSSGIESHQKKRAGNLTPSTSFQADTVCIRNINMSTSESNF